MQYAKHPHSNHFMPMFYEDFHKVEILAFYVLLEEGGILRPRNYKFSPNWASFFFQSPFDCLEGSCRQPLFTQDIFLSENVMNKFDQSRQDLRSSEKKRREVKFF